MINLKNLNKFISYDHFKMEGLHCLKFFLEQDNLLCKIDLKEAYFSVTFNKNSHMFVRFNGQATYTYLFAYVLDLASSKNFFKVIKSLNRPLEMGQQSSHHLPRKYVASWEHITRNYHGERH